EELIKLVKRAVNEDELAAAFAPGLDLHRRAELLRPLFFEPRDVAIDSRAPRRGAFHSAGHALLDFANREPFHCGLARKLDLTRDWQREERPRVAHVDPAFGEKLAHRRREVEQPQKIG